MKFRVPNCGSGSRIRLDDSNQTTSHKPQESKALLTSQAQELLHACLHFVSKMTCLFLVLIDRHTVRVSKLACTNMHSLRLYWYTFSKSVSIYHHQNRILTRFHELESSYRVRQIVSKTCGRWSERKRQHQKRKIRAAPEAPPSLRTTGVFLILLSKALHAKKATIMTCSSVIRKIWTVRQHCDTLSLPSN